MRTRLIGALALMAAGPLIAGNGGNFPPPAEAPETEEAAPDVLQAQRDRYERLTIPVTIDGNGPYRFMVDTGSQATVVSRSVSEQLQLLPLGKATLVAMGSRREVDLVQLDGLEFAGRLFDNLEAPLLEAYNVGADGILGLNSLQDMRVLIDFKEDRLLVADADTLGGNRGYEIVVRARRRLGQMIITDAKIDGIKTSVIIDTGAQNTVANMALKAKMRAKGDVILESTDVNGVKVYGNLGYAKKMAIGGLEMTGIPVTFADSPAFEALGLAEKPALIMGMRNLQNFERIAIDFSTGQVLFDVPSGAYNVKPYQRQFFPTRIPGQ
jgi:predicted aspartyl protease